MVSQKLAVVAITEHGQEIAKKISRSYRADIFLSQRFQPAGNIKIFVSLKGIIKDLFDQYDYIIFIMALGAVVRLISPYLKNKLEDPPAIAIDDAGKFVIPVTGGHHGSNELSMNIAAILNATAVITTASDVNGIPSLEMLAKKYSMSIKNIENLANVSMDMIDGVPVKVVNKTNLVLQELKDSGTGKSIIISYKIEDDKSGVILIPKVLDIGIGFSTGATYKDMKYAIEFVFDKYGFELESIRSLSTIDIKQNNEGLKDVARDLNCIVNYYSADKLNENSTAKSDVVYMATGAYSVSNASARIASSDGRELVPKEIINNTTISVFLHEV